MRYELHIALSDLNEDKDIEEFKFNDINELTHKINSFGLKDDRVFLCCIHGADDDAKEAEVFISESYVFLRSFIESYEDNLTVDLPLKVFFFQYETYEDAYKTALDMRETNELCYNP